MREFSEIDYQRQLIVSGIDDFSPNAALPHVFGGQFGSSPEKWRAAVVEFLCINVRVGLLECVNRKEMSGENGEVLLRRLLSFGDKERSMDVELVWSILYFSSTPKMDGILQSLGLNSWDALNQGVSRQFFEILRGLYFRV
ncbi:hypothetical protein LGN20_04010 [Burkholderia cepacia]|uniref:hypothetical protein n=1 Tax=Burkholderia TaxID=32008 RepID=UPI000F5F04D4|nr:MULTISPECIES: hypothetical protein [Burkholderia]MBY4712157.1 hypothetical protein [Burkholderia cepacia]MBY4738066.1 hypothetical protein [Burkholderia cepacia]MBY4745799.1 hypothetical protein [Burkholderia cepacia]MBY4759597.1 hypothetical protein [Burkholderia cepacia]MBY4773909.1 hypothetical protein [Burkholderia cepacia]